MLEIGGAGPLGKRRIETGDGLPRAPRLEKRDGEIVASVAEFRVYPQSLLEIRDGFFTAIERPQDKAEIVQKSCGIDLLFPRRFQKRDCVLVFPGLAEEFPEFRENCEIPRRQIERGLEQTGRLVRIAVPAKGTRALECPAGAQRARARGPRRCGSGASGPSGGLVAALGGARGKQAIRQAWKARIKANVRAAISGEVWPSTTAVASGRAASAATKRPLARIIDRPRSRCSPGTRVETTARSPSHGASASMARVCAAERRWSR